LVIVFGVRFFPCFDIYIYICALFLQERDWEADILSTARNAHCDACDTSYFRVC
jgi:hypothetical protein